MPFQQPPTSASSVVCFGEVLLRLTPPGHQRLLQSPSFDVYIGGAEANVAVSLTRFGHPAKLVSALPDSGLGEGCRTALSAHHVDVSAVQTRPGRLGVYFCEKGAGVRPSKVVYDRAHSAFAEMTPGDFDWPKLLADARYLHLSGITAAVGPGPAAAAVDAVETARRLGVRVSFDGNYREGLWRAWGGDGPRILGTILAQADLAFINELDIALITRSAVESRRDAVRRAFAQFPSLQNIAATKQTQRSVTALTFSAELYSRSGAALASRVYEIDHVVDRIGRGDAFAAGILYGLLEDFESQRTLDFAAAAAAIKHSIPGDWNLTTVKEIEATHDGHGLAHPSLTDRSNAPSLGTKMTRPSNHQPRPNLRTLNRFVGSGGSLNLAPRNGRHPQNRDRLLNTVGGYRTAWHLLAAAFIDERRPSSVTLDSNFELTREAPTRRPLADSAIGMPRDRREELGDVRNLDTLADEEGEPLIGQLGSRTLHQENNGSHQ